MTKQITALSLSVLGVMAPIGAIKHQQEISIQEEQAILLQKQLEEQQAIALAEDAKLKILEKEAKIAETKIAERERISSVTFSPQDIRVPSNLKTQELKQIFENTPGASKMIHLAPAFIDAEKVYNVNALALSGLVAVESAWNTSRRAVEQNNLTGYAVYSDSSVGKDFLSDYECIMETARLLSKHYLSPDGKWHNGYSLESVNTMYSSDKEWYTKICQIGNDLLSEYHNIISEVNNSEI